MMNSNKLIDSGKIISRVMKLLENDAITRKIDLPILEAAATFTITEHPGVSSKKFIKTIGQFIQHIYKNSINIRQKMLPHKAEAEAITILEMNYQNEGFYAAYLDAQNQNIDGLKCVFDQVIEIIIQRRRNDYLNWVVTTHISSLDWCTKCEIVRIIQKQWAAILPSQIKNYPPEMLTDSIPNLINVCIDADNATISLSASGISPELF